MSGLETEMNRLVGDFVKQVTELALNAARDTLGSMFGQNGGPALGANGGTKSATAAAGAPVGRGRPVGARGVKRAPEDIEALAKTFSAFVKANPGLRIEQINKELGTTTKDLALPIRKLEAEGIVSTKGQRRSTQYFPGKKAK